MYVVLGYVVVDLWLFEGDDSMTSEPHDSSKVGQICRTRSWKAHCDAQSVRPRLEKP